MVISTLLKVPEDKLEKTLTTKSMSTDKDSVVIPLRVEAASQNRDSLAKVCF